MHGGTLAACQMQHQRGNAERHSRRQQKLFQLAAASVVMVMVMPVLVCVLMMVVVAVAAVRMAMVMVVMRVLTVRVTVRVKGLDMHAVLNAVANRLNLCQRLVSIAFKLQFFGGKVKAHLVKALCLGDFCFDFRRAVGAVQILQQ